MPNKTNPNRKYAILTKSDRKYILADGAGYNRHDKHERKNSIVFRTKNALTDFQLLASSNLPADFRDEIFDAELRTREFAELQAEVRAAVAFLYAGLGGESGFRKPLLEGVSHGENLLGNVETIFDIESRFEVDYVGHAGRREAVSAIEKREWDKLSSRSLYRFVNLAHNAGAIDFGAIRTLLDQHEEAQEVLENHDDATDVREALREKEGGVDVDRARERLEQGKELGGNEMKALVECGDAELKSTE